MHKVYLNSLLIKIIKCRLKPLSTVSYSTNHQLKPPWKVLFFGTDDFSLSSLKILDSEYRKGHLLKRLEIVTSLKTKQTAVYKYASQENLILHNWPMSPNKCKDFDVGLVVSFGHLIPAEIINSFPLGMINVHASLLPRWRGAAPIVYALANGDKKTGVTIMKIKPCKFDVGEIITQASLDISDTTKMPDLYNKLAILGADTLVKVLNNLVGNLNNAIPQPEAGVTYAPRINSKIAHIDWQRMTSENVYNLQRALTGVFHLTTKFNDVPIKLYDIDNVSVNDSKDEHVPGLAVYDKKLKVLRIQCRDGKWIAVKSIGIPGKKMSAADFYNGFISKQINKVLLFR